MILGIIYFVMAGVILALVINNLKLSDKVEAMQKNNDYWFKQYLEEKKENDENKQIIEKIKESMTF